MKLGLSITIIIFSAYLFQMKRKTSLSVKKNSKEDSGVFTNSIELSFNL